jgi:hypothetical protein
MHLIGLGADEAGLHPVHRGIEIVGRSDAEIAEALDHLAMQPAGKGAAAAQLVFIDPALAFMHAHRHALPDRRQQVVGVDALLIGGMADLVDGRVEAVERIAFDHPRGDPHILPGPLLNGCTAMSSRPRDQS